jgi:hypothetical protein
MRSLGFDGQSVELPQARRELAGTRGGSTGFATFIETDPDVGRPLRLLIHDLQNIVHDLRRRAVAL